MPNWPYADVEVGHEVEVQVFVAGSTEGGYDLLRARCEFRGDEFGADTVLDGSSLDQKIATDELVEGMAMLVWHELLGTPVFREEDEEWTERVAARARWEGTERHPTNGYVQSRAEPEPDPERPVPRDPEPVPEPERERVSIEEHLGDADVSDLRLTQEEMAGLMRGEIPDEVIEKLLAARSTENLLESVSDAIDGLLESVPGDDHESETLRRIQRELATVRSRFG